MSFADLGMAFDAYGIGTVLLRNKLRVPENQRPYAWREEHVQQLFEDLAAAFRTPKAPYFLGTIVLTGKGDDQFDVTDGQQRLATTSILIAAIRDFLEPRGEQGRKTAAKYTVIIFSNTTNFLIRTYQNSFLGWMITNFFWNTYFLRERSLLGSKRAPL